MRSRSSLAGPSKISLYLSFNKFGESITFSAKSGNFFNILTKTFLEGISEVCYLKLIQKVNDRCVLNMDNVYLGLAIQKSDKYLIDIVRSHIGNSESYSHIFFSNPELASKLPFLVESSIVKEIEAQLSHAKSKGIRCITPFCEEYPKSLKEIPDPPLVLWVLGPAILSKPAVAIVGARNADRYGMDIAHVIARDLASLGVVVVSGMALGIDSGAHKGAIAAKVDQPSFAILGNGLDKVYPTRNQSLAHELLDIGGVLISEYPPNTPPYPANFLFRNRIIAGLSLGVVVIQAALRSGSLVTARCALEYNREVMAVPGSIHDPRSEGTNNLIRKGGALVTSASDIVEIFGDIISKPLLTDDKNTNKITYNSVILRKLQSEGDLHFEELRMKLKMAAEDLSAELTELELTGVVESLPGNFIRLAKNY